MGDASAFLGVLVTILVLCVITDESNFLLRTIIALLRKPLRDKYKEQLAESSDESKEKWVSSISRIKCNELLHDKEYLGRFICLLTNEFPAYLDVTLYTLMYAIALFCLDEFHGWLFHTKNSFLTSVVVFTSSSILYWLYCWFRFCKDFKVSFGKIALNICIDVEEILLAPKHQPKTIFKGRKLGKKFRLFFSIFIPAIVISLLFQQWFPIFFKEWSQILDEELIRHVCFLFIILNFFVLPVSLTWFFCSFKELLKSKLYSLTIWSKDVIRVSSKVICFLISHHFIAFLILVFFFLLGIHQ